MRRRAAEAAANGAAVAGGLMHARWGAARVVAVLPQARNYAAVGKESRGMQKKHIEYGGGCEAECGR